MRQVLKPTAFALVAMMTFSAPALAEETIGQKIDSWWSSVKEWASETSDAAEQEGRTVLGAMQNDIDKLGDAADKAGDAAKKKWAESKVEIDRLRADADQKLDALGKASKENWEEAKKEANEALEALNGKIEEADHDMQNLKD